MFTEINLVFSTPGYYHNTYGNWHTINGVLNQELLQEKHNLSFPVHLDKKVLVNFSNTSGFVILPIYWAPLTPTNENHLQAEEVRRGTAKSAASTTTDKDPQAVKAQQTQLPQLPRGTIPPTPSSVGFHLHLPFHNSQKLRQWHPQRRKKRVWDSSLKKNLLFS